MVIQYTNWCHQIECGMILLKIKRRCLPTRYGEVIVNKIKLLQSERIDCINNKANMYSLLLVNLST